MNILAGLLATAILFSYVCFLGCDNFKKAQLFFAAIIAISCLMGSFVVGYYVSAILGRI